MNSSFSSRFRPPVLSRRGTRRWPGNPCRIRCAGSPCIVQRWLTVLVMSSAFVLSSDAEPPVNWRNYRAPNGLPNSLATGVALGAGGALIVKHGGDNRLSLFDGYTSSQLPSPGEALLVVKGGSAGKVWALYDNGFMQYEEEQWILRPVREVADVMRSPMPDRKQLRWCSVQPDVVLFLVGDRLLHYDAKQEETTTVLNAAQTKLGKFLDLGAGGEGTIWLTGTDGLMRLGPAFFPGEVETNAKVFFPPTGAAIKNLRRPMNDEANGVTMLANSTSSNNQLWVRYADGVWQTGTLPDPRVNCAWCVPDGTIWFLSPYALFRCLPGGHMDKETSLAAQVLGCGGGQAGYFLCRNFGGRFSIHPAALAGGARP